MRNTVLIILAAMTVGNVSPINATFADVFTPNAAVCVKFDDHGDPTAALINGERFNRLNRQMLETLQKGTWWGKDYRKTGGKWIPLSVAPNGFPVPEILPTCPKD